MCHSVGRAENVLNKEGFHAQQHSKKLSATQPLVLLSGSEHCVRLGETGIHWLYNLNQDFTKFLTFNRSLADKATQPLYQTPTSIFNITVGIMICGHC